MNKSIYLPHSPLSPSRSPSLLAAPDVGKLLEVTLRRIFKISPIRHPHGHPSPQKNDLKKKTRILCLPSNQQKKTSHLSTPNTLFLETVTYPFPTFEWMIFFSPKLFFFQNFLEGTLLQSTNGLLIVGLGPGGLGF